MRLSTCAFLFLFFLILHTPPNSFLLFYILLLLQSIHSLQFLQFTSSTALLIILRSVGYRGEDGFQQSRPGGGEGSTFEAFGPAFGRGDVVGCGVVNSSRGVFFTKNGVFLGNAGRVEPLANLYPTVSLKHNGDAIRVNFRGPFLFNLRLLFHRQLMEERQMIRQEHLNPDTLLSLVRSYLLHSGFEKTLKAFNETVGKPKQRKRKTDEGDNNASPNNHSISPNASSSNGSNSSSNSSFNNVSSNISGSNGEEQDRDMENEKETTETNETNGEETGTPQLASADSNTEDEGDKEDREAVLVVWPPAVPQRLSRSLAQRASVVQAIMDGRISEAIHLLKAHFPLVLAPSHDDACSLARVLLLSQEVVEALRPPKKDLKTAIMCIRRNIAPLMKEVSPMLRKVASECLGVLAYEDPATSPSSHVFHLSRRSLTASAVNRTILKKHLHVTVWSPLEVLVRHLVACRQVLRTLGGSRGPVPSSREYSHPLPLRQTIEALEAELL